MEAICEQQATDIFPGAGTSESLKCYTWWYLYLTFLLFLYTRTFYGTSSLHYKSVCWEEFFLLFLMWKYTTTINIVDNICVCVCLCIILTHFKQCLNFIEMHKRDNSARVPEFFFQNMFEFPWTFDSLAHSFQDLGYRCLTACPTQISAQTKHYFPQSAVTFQYQRHSLKLLQIQVVQRPLDMFHLSTFIY